MIVGFSTTNRLVSKIIRFLTRSKVSHSYLCFTIYDRKVAFQSDHRGVGLEDYEAFKKHNIVVAEYRTDLAFDTLMPEMVSFFGKKYDMFGLIGQIWVLIGAIFRKSWENPLQHKDQWYCSELASHLLIEAGEKIPCTPAACSPQRLLNYISENPTKFNLEN